MRSRPSPWKFLFVISLTACSTPEKPAAEPPPPPPVAQAEAPIARVAAPRASAGLAFFPGGADSCGHAVLKTAETEALPLKVGAIPAAIPATLNNQLIEKTRVWKVESSSFDFYRILSGGQPGGLRLDRPAIGCIRYSMTEQDGSPHADMIFSVTYNPKTPEVVTLKPVRIQYRDFAALSANSGAAEAALEVGLSLKTYSLERTSGRVGTSLQNQEMAVELFRNRGPGQPIDQFYDPVNGPSAMVPLPPWDYSSKSDNPRHNLSILAITVTEIADFDWLQAQIHRLWPSWEYEATDVAKIKDAAEFYSHTHAP